MTRRITVAILVSVWSMMLAAGLTAYFATRSVLLSELDARLVARAAALPEVSGLSGTGPDAEDRYLIRSGQGQVVRRAEPDAPALRPQVIAAQFARLGDGRSYRSVTLRFEKPATPNATASEITVTYSGPADSFERVLTRLAVALLGFGLVGGIAAAAVAGAASRTAMRPLGDVADVIGEIDECNLSRRVDAERLPVELKPIANRLNDMLTRLEDNVARRRQFLADASHELRTPVAALVTTLEVNLARRQPDIAGLRRALDNCLSDARLLRGLVERLTAQVRGERPASTNEVREIDLAVLIDRCMTVAEGLAAARQIRVRADRPEGLFIRTQPDRLQRVLLNLLSNAVAYNVDGGQVSVHCATVRAGADVQIDVCDTGIGITAEHLPHVFSLFYRADAARDTGEGHLGLGLYQVQADVASMNGTCEVKSEPGAGTTMTIRLMACVLPASVEPVTATDSEATQRIG